MFLKIASPAWISGQHGPGALRAAAGAPPNLGTAWAARALAPLSSGMARM